MQRGERGPVLAGDELAMAHALHQPQHAAWHGLAGNAAADEERAADPARIRTVDVDAGHRHACLEGEAKHGGLVGDRQYLDGCIGDDRRHQRVARAAVVGVEQHVLASRACRRLREERDRDRRAPVLRQEGCETRADRALSFAHTGGRHGAGVEGVTVEGRGAHGVRP